MSTENQQQVEQEIEISIDVARATIVRAEKLHRLHSNKDFQDIILEGYFEKESQRLVGLICDPSMEAPIEQQGLRESMIGISALQRYFQVTYQIANQMSQKVRASQAELDNLRDGDEETEEQGE